MFSNTYVDSLYDNIYDWLSVHSVGGYCTLGRLRWYDKNLWNQLLIHVANIKNKSVLSDDEKEFLCMACYTGNVYRLQTYCKKYKGHIVETKYFQHWSKDIKSLDSLHTAGRQLLIIGKVNPDAIAFDVFGLLTFLLKHYKINYQYKNPRSLLRYEEENEIAHRMLFDSIQEIRVIDSGDIDNWETRSIVIDRSTWERKIMY